MGVRRFCLYVRCKATHLVAHLRVIVASKEELESVLVRSCHDRLVALRKHEQRLVPQHRQLACLVHEANKVLDERVDDAVGKRVLFVEEDGEEDGGGAAVRHLSELEEP